MAGSKDLVPTRAYAALAKIKAIEVSLAAEGNKVGSLIIMEIPVFMGPVLARSAHSCFGFVNNKGNTLTLSQFSEFLIESRSGNLVSYRTNGFHNYGCTLVVFENILCYFEAAVLFLGVLVLVSI